MKDGHTGLYKTEPLGENVTSYSAAHSNPLPKHIVEYHAHIAATRDDSYFMSSNFQSQWHVLLAKMVGAKRVLEIGVYVGYSAMVWAHAVGSDGSVTGLEYSETYAQVSREIFKKNNIENIEILVGPASETIPTLTPQVPYDLVFIDADKVNYPTYLNQLLQGSLSGSQNRLLKPGALIVTDNVLLRGMVADEKALGDAPVSEMLRTSTKPVQVFNDLCLQNSRLEVFLMPLWDGLSIARVID